MSFLYNKRLKDLKKIINLNSISPRRNYSYSDLFSVYYTYQLFLKNQVDFKVFTARHIDYLKCNNDYSNKFYFTGYLFYRNIIILDNKEAFRMFLELIVYGYIIDYTGCYAYYYNIDYSEIKHKKDIRELDYTLYNFLIENNIPVIFTIPKLTNEFVLYDELVKNMETFYKTTEEEIAESITV